MTLAYFHILGNVLELTDKLMIWANAGDICPAASLTVLVSIKSTPVADEFFRLCMVLNTSWVVTLSILNVQVLSLMTSLSFLSGSLTEWSIELLSLLILSKKNLFMVRANPAALVTSLPSLYSWVDAPPPPQPSQPFTVFQMSEEEFPWSSSLCFSQTTLSAQNF